MRSRSIALAFAACVVLASPFARADDATERARALFDEAGELERQGRWSVAQEKLRSALRIRETPQLRYALAWALENADQLLEAKAEYDAAIRGGARAGADDVVRRARLRLADVEQKTPIIELRGSLRTRVVLDGRLANERAPVTTLPVNPGTHVLRFERSGRPPSEQIVYVQRSEHRVVALMDDDSEARRNALRDRRGARDDKLASWLLCGGGAALLASGSAIALSARSGESTQQAVGITLGSVGVSAAAIGVWMLLVRREPVIRF